MATVIYGIKNCDTVRKALKWMDNNNHGYQYHDFREQGLEKNHLMQWCEILGWEKVINKRSTTWKNLPVETRENINEKTAISLMLENPTLIKRPVLQHGKTVINGFNEKTWQDAL